MSLPRRLARPEILELEPYASAWDDEPDRDAFVRLDANESPWAPFPSQEGLNRYPEPQPARLRHRLASLYGIAADRLLVTRGSDESIDLLVRVFCRPTQDAVVICPPTFGYYAVAAGIQGAVVLAVARDESFGLDEDAIVAACESSSFPVKLVFLCSPNNPTGNATEPERIVALAKRLPDQIVVVDEAYVEFSPTESLAGRIQDDDGLENLVVLRTLSKAFGLAGARCGAALARPELLDLLRRALAPYPISAPSATAVLKALEPHGVALARDRVATVQRRREELEARLSTCVEVRRVHPSEANFLLLDVVDDARFTAKLRDHGVRVRRFESLPGRVRLSIGTEEETALLLRALGFDTEASKPRREATIRRSTNETEIAATVYLDSPEVNEIDTGIAFFDHMLEQVARHGGFGLRLTCRGDLEVDAHHTVEDCALVLGKALDTALGDRRGIERYGFVLPMDEARAEVLVDLSGRPASVFEGRLPDSRVGGLATELVPHVFESLSQGLRAAIHVRVDGHNTHHMVESCFKAFGRALRQALRRVGSGVPSTKGVL